jgi:hypothetical protein
MADADGDKQKNGAVANALATEHKSTIESTAGATIFDIDIILCVTALRLSFDIIIICQWSVRQ